MGTYYTHTKNASIDVPYSFKCEQCMKDSGMLIATITAQAEINSNFKKLEDKKVEKLNEMAHTNLVREVKNAQRNANEKHIYAKSFKDECPYCRKPQSWALGAMKKDMFSTPIVCVILGLIVAAGCYLFREEAGVNMTVVIAVAAIGLAAGLISLIVNIIKIGAKKKQVSTAGQKNLPNIEWSAVQNLLNE